MVGASGDPAAVLSPDLVDSGVPTLLGSLPLVTQRFLFEPFTGGRSRASNAWVHAHRDRQDAETRERLWAYVFNARWIGFAFTERLAPTRSERWRRGADEALRGAPWRVCAWVAPVRRGDASGPGA